MDGWPPADRDIIDGWVAQSDRDFIDGWVTQSGRDWYRWMYYALFGPRNLQLGPHTAV